MAEQQVAAPRPAGLLTAREAAGELGIAVTTLKRIAPSELPFVRIRDRGDRRYHVEDLRAYANGRKVTS